MPIVRGYVIDADRRSVHRYDVEAGYFDPFDDDIFARIEQRLGYPNTTWFGVYGEFSDLIAICSDETTAGGRMQVGDLHLRGKCFLTQVDCRHIDGYMDVPFTLGEVRKMTVFWG